MKITQITDDAYQVETCGGLRRIVVTGARIVVRRTGRVGNFVQRLVGFVDATQTRFEATIRWLTGREIQKLLPNIPVELGIAKRLVSRIARRLGQRQTLELLANLAETPMLLPTH